LSILGVKIENQMMYRMRKGTPTCGPSLPVPPRLSHDRPHPNVPPPTPPIQLTATTPDPSAPPDGEVAADSYSSRLRSLPQQKFAPATHRRLRPDLLEIPPTLSPVSWLQGKARDAANFFSTRSGIFVFCDHVLLPGSQGTLIEEQLHPCDRIGDLAQPRSASTPTISSGIWPH
jgi:hypothetical protein